MKTTTPTGPGPREGTESIQTKASPWMSPPAASLMAASGLAPLGSVLGMIATLLLKRRHTIPIVRAFQFVRAITLIAAMRFLPVGFDRRVRSPCL